jgi:hypothetical protein
VPEEAADVRFLINTRTNIVHFADNEDGEWLTRCGHQPSKKHSELRKYRRKKHIRQYSMCRFCIGTFAPSGPSDKIMKP